ncbi:outer membrane TonB-dependent heme receptor [Bordetella ansorpii]|uniref:Outer membrane TonB-dependent heme receptor n=1 Tax=Bordetella ansorpii TaxID=288768 RepID=A0A157SFJ9_9BORD|nr:outer membrane TonB-dependent heme receptor [Bordetella ansorpii]
MIRFLLATFVVGGACGMLPALAKAADSGSTNMAIAAAGMVVEFDIPAQPLQSAIEQYSIATGRSVVYLGTLVLGRTSQSVQGSYTPEAALSLLLAGTGLAVSHTTAEAFILMQAESRLSPRRPAGDGAQASPASRTYYGSVQSGLRDVLCGDSLTAPGDFRAALQFWVDPTGRVSQVHLLDTTGDIARDQAILRAMRGAAVERPPPGLAQPFTMIILPRSAATSVDCHVH